MSPIYTVTYPQEQGVSTMHIRHITNELLFSHYVMRSRQSLRFLAYLHTNKNGVALTFSWITCFNGCHRIDCALNPRSPVKNPYLPSLRKLVVMSRSYGGSCSCSLRDSVAASAGERERLEEHVDEQGFFEQNRSIERSSTTSTMGAQKIPVASIR